MCLTSRPALTIRARLYGPFGCAGASHVRRDDAALKDASRVKVLLQTGSSQKKEFRYSPHCIQTKYGVRSRPRLKRRASCHRLSV